MKKLVPVFLVFAAFFLLALAAGMTYDQARDKAPLGVAHEVSLLGDHADPDQLIIKTGESVQFSSSDNVDHNLAEDADGFQSGLFKPDQGYRWQFKQAGSYDVYDRLHPKIKIKIVVYDPSK